MESSDKVDCFGRPPTKKSVAEKRYADGIMLGRAKPWKGLDEV